MNRSEMNTFSFLTNRDQQDDSDYSYEPKVQGGDENKRLPLIVGVSLITLIILPFLIMMVQST